MAVLAGPSFQEGKGSWAREAIELAKITARRANVLRIDFMIGRSAR